jgi:hypothetical protein
MSYFRNLFLVGALFYLNSGFPQEKVLHEITITQNDKSYSFRCDGIAGDSAVSVMLRNVMGIALLIKQKLNHVDNCDQVSWLTEKIGHDSSQTLVLLNPGRLGLNAQTIAFVITDNGVTFAGYLPVSAEKVGDSIFRSYSSEAGSVWERTDDLVGGKFAVIGQLQLMLSGEICANKVGEILAQDPCNAVKTVARPRKPICIQYQLHKGRLVPVSACARLTAQM